jgi:hypothetical protein
MRQKMRQLISRKSAIDSYKKNQISDISFLWRLLFFGYFSYLSDFYNFITLSHDTQRIEKNIESYYYSNIEIYFSKALSIVAILSVYYVYKKMNKSNFLNFFLALFIPITLQSFFAAGIYLFLIALPLKMLAVPNGKIIGGYSVIVFYYLVFLILYLRTIKKLIAN